MKTALLFLFPLIAAAQITTFPPTSSSGGGPPTGAAGGDLSGTYPNPTIATGKPLLNNLGDPGATKAFAMGSNFLTFTFGATTGAAANMMIVQDTASNTGTGYVFTAGTASSSAANPFQVLCGGVQCASILPATSEFRVGDATVYTVIGRAPGGFNGGVYFNATPSASNYTLAGTATDTFLGAPGASGTIHFKIANSTEAFTLITSSASFFGGKAIISSVGTLSIPQVQGIGSAPTVTATGTGCSNPTVATGSNNLAGSLTATGTGAACTFVFTWSGAFAFAHQGNVHLQNNTTPSDIITQSAANTTTTTLVGPVVSGDVVTYTVMGW